jgi:alkaline phosphatase
MTRKAIDLLEGSAGGFFLMVEASRIDHASHGNDPAGTLHDVLAYDRAFQEAIDFARRDGRTLVVGVADHETGGLSLGRALAPELEPPLDKVWNFWRSFESGDVYDWKPAVLERVEASAGVMAEAIRAGRNEIDVMRDLGGLADLTEEERAALSLAREDGDLARVVGEIISRHAGIGWTTGGHTALDVSLYAFGPGSEVLHGNLDNAYVGQVLQRLLEGETISELAFP